jgi:hypothetical protein
MTRLSLPPGTAENVLRRVTPEPERPLPTNPSAWIRGTLDEHLWSKQREIVASVVEHRDTAVMSGHGIGKSYIASRIAAWWIAGHPRGEALVVTTAPSGHQVRTILWGEIGRAHRKGGLPGTITRGQVPEWQIDGELVAFGRKPTDYVSAEQARTQFQGIHARYLLVILDEAGGVPEWLWDATATLITNDASRRLAIGNPDDPTTRFEAVCRPGSGWNVVQVSVFDTPNFTGERVPEQLRESLVGKAYVDTAAREWGEDSPLYISKVKGEFPEVADDVVITPKMVREAHERSLPGLERGRFGMDVARLGPDETVVYRNRGGVIRLMSYTDRFGQEQVMAWRKADTTASAQRVRNMLEVPALSYVPMTIDVVGLGAGVYDPLVNAGFRVHPFNGGEAARDPSRFVNKRTEAWWGFREGCEAGLIDLDADDELLAAQLQQPKWRLDASGRRIRLETKEEMAKRGLKSPDRADAAVMAWYEPAQVGDPNAVLPENGDRAITAGLLEALT